MNHTQLKLQEKMTTDGVMLVPQKSKHKTASVGFSELYVAPPAALTASVTATAFNQKSKDFQQKNKMKLQHSISLKSGPMKDIKDDFLDSMGQVTMQRELKIKTDLKQEKIRIKKFKENLTK